MKKYLFFITGGLLFTALLFTGCIKNEETAGVKSLRMAQASLIQARADQESALIAANVAYAEAEAAMEQSRADIQRAAADEAIAGSEVRIAIIRAEQEAKLAKAVADAESALSASKKNLEVALRDLEKEIAKSEVENPTLDEYMAKYKATILKIESLQSNIISKQKDINAKNIEISFGGATQAKINTLEKYQRDLLRQEDLKTRYAAANTDPSTIFGSLNEAEVVLEGLEADEDDLNAQIVTATAAVATANTAMTDAATAYGDIQGFVEDVEDFTSTIGHSKSIDAKILDELSDDPSATATSFKSLVDYDLLIVAAQDDVVDAQEIRTNLQQQLTAVTALHNAYKNALTAKQNARKTALSTYRSAVQAYNVALLAASGDITAAPVVTANTAKDNAETAFNTADTELTDLKNNISGAALDFGVLGGSSEWDDVFYTWVGNNDEKIEDLIEDLATNDIPAAQEDLDDAQNDLAELQADRAIVVDYIAYLQNELGASAANVATLKADYFAAKTAWTAAKTAKEAKDDELVVLTAEITYATAVRDALEGDYTRITTKLEDLDTEIENLKTAVIAADKAVQTEGLTDLEFLQGELEVLQVELSHLQEQLTVEKSSAAVYLQLITAEIGS